MKKNIVFKKVLPVFIATALCISNVPMVGWNVDVVMADEETNQGSTRPENAIDLSALTETYVISDSGEYYFYGESKYGIKVENESPTIILDNVSILVEGKEYKGSYASAIDIIATNSETTIQVVNGESTLTGGLGAGIFVAEGSSVHITSDNKTNVLRVTGMCGSPAIGGLCYGDSDYSDTSINCGNITISNIVLYAKAEGRSGLGSVAPGIGSAGKGTCGTIRIENATVYAYGSGDDFKEECLFGAGGIGCGMHFAEYSETIPTIHIKDSDIHTYRECEYSDYIGWYWDMNEYKYGESKANDAINCGTDGSVKNSTIYCYTGADAIETDKIEKYGLLGNVLVLEETSGKWICADEHIGGIATCIGQECDNCGVYYGSVDENAHLTDKDENKATCQHGDICELCATEYSEKNDNHTGTLGNYALTEDSTQHVRTYDCCSGKIIEDHILTYFLNEAGDTIIVSCDADCGYTDSVTLFVENKNCDGNAVNVTIEKPDVLEDKDITISYALKEGESLVSAPTVAGTYVANIMVGDKTVSKEFTISCIDTDKNGICDGCKTRVAYLVGVTSRLLGTPETVAHISMNPSDGYVNAGEEIALTAPNLLNYTFKGWYLLSDINTSNQINDTAIVQSTSLVYKFIPETDMSLVAVYESAEKNVNVTFSGTNYTVSVNGGDASAVQNSTYTDSIAIGSEVTITVTDEDFINWLNENNMIVTTEKNYTFTVTGEIALTMSKKGTSGSSAMVEFVSAYNQVISSQIYDSDDTIKVPVGPSKIGYTFKGWSLTEEEIRTKITEGETHITVTPIYEQDTSVTYTVTVLVDEIADDTQSVTDILAGTIKTFSAPTIDGKVFLYWTDETDTILGYDVSYSMKINKNITLKAVYGEKEVEKTPVIAMTNIFTTSAEGKNKLSFSATRDVPDGYTVVETGMLYSAWKTDTEPSEDTFILGGNEVRKYVSTDTILAGVFTLNVNVTNNESTKIAARGYMIVKNEKTGTQEIYYTNIACNSYNEIIGEEIGE